MERSKAKIWLSESDEGRYRGPTRASSCRLAQNGRAKDAHRGRSRCAVRSDRPSRVRTSRNAVRCTLQSHEARSDRWGRVNRSKACVAQQPVGRHRSVRLFQLGFSGLYTARRERSRPVPVRPQGWDGGAEPAAGFVRVSRVSPDGKRLAFETTMEKRQSSRFTSCRARARSVGSPSAGTIGSPSGPPTANASPSNRIAKVIRPLFWQSVDGGAVQRLTKPDPGTAHVPESWSPAGDTLLFSATKGSATSLWTLSGPNRKVMPFADVEFRRTRPIRCFHRMAVGWPIRPENQAKRMAPRTSSHSRPAARSYQDSPRGRPLWSRDGKELFYIPTPTQLMVVTVGPNRAGRSRVPVDVPRGFGVSSPTTPRTFDILPDAGSWASDLWSEPKRIRAGRRFTSC
jgi:hypothetical protein